MLLTSSGSGAFPRRLPTISFKIPTPAKITTKATINPIIPSAYIKSVNEEINKATIAADVAKQSFKLSCFTALALTLLVFLNILPLNPASHNLTTIESISTTSDTILNVTS